MLLNLLLQAATSFIHGDCIGADAEAHSIAMSLKLEVLKRPSYLDNQRAFTEGGQIIADPERPLVRNKRIVEQCDVLLACPCGPEKLRSGTWSTVRYARNVGRDGLVIMPDGTMQPIGEKR